LTKAVEKSKAGYNCELKENHRIPWMRGGGGVGRERTLELKKERETVKAGTQRKKRKKGNAEDR
jgi:hypothetical protein